MTIFLVTLLLIIVKSIKLIPFKEYNHEYITKENTIIIKGIFVVFVLFRHATQYISLTGCLDKYYIYIDNLLGQMIVAMFLFYSGFGIMESITKKGNIYIKSIPLKHIINLLFNFNIAVLIYLLINTIFHIKFSWDTIILSFLAWDNIGNSNWYILNILGLYFITFFSFYFFYQNNNKFSIYYCTIILTIFSMCFVVFQLKMGKPYHYYNTAILYSFGCWYSLARKKVESFFQFNICNYYISLMTITIILSISYNLQNDFGIFSYTIWGFTFTSFFLLLTMKFKIYNSLLSWLGNHIFSIYILQRIPMIIFSNTAIINNKYLFIILSISATLIISPLFEQFTNKLWLKLLCFKSKN